MKKAFVVGMVVVSTLAGNVSFAAGVVAKAPREVLMEYTKQSKEALFGKGGSAKSMSEASASQVKETLIKELNLSSSQATSLKASLAGEAGKARLENLVTIIAAKRYSTETLAKTDKAEATSIEKAADASANMMANSVLVGAVKDAAIVKESASKDALNAIKLEDLSLIRETIQKFDAITGETIVNFSKAERDSHTSMKEKIVEMTASGKIKSYEEAVYLVFLEKTGGNKEKALELMKKFKECV